MMTVAGACVHDSESDFMRRQYGKRHTGAAYPDVTYDAVLGDDNVTLLSYMYQRAYIVLSIPSVVAIIVPKLIFNFDFDLLIVKLDDGRKRKSMRRGFWISRNPQSYSTNFHARANIPCTA